MGASRHRLVLFAVNPRPEPVELKVGFGEGATGARVVKAEALQDTRHAGQPEVMNHWQRPDRVRIAPIPVSGDVVSLPGLSAAAIECQVN